MSQTPYIQLIKPAPIPFEDAQELAQLHPDTFDCPSLETLAQLRVGDLVKVCTGDERFWTTIERIDGETITARVDNVLLHTENHGLSADDLVQFERRHIYSIYEE